MPKTKGSGEAYQSWNSDQAIATQSRIVAASADRLAAPGIGFGDKLLEIDARAAGFVSITPLPP